MITLCRAAERRVELATWFTFGDSAGATLHAGGFFGLRAIVEVRLPPSASLPAMSAEGIELVTYVHEGALALEDSAGHASEIHVGEVHIHCPGTESRLHQANASSTSWAHVFRVGLLVNLPTAASDGPRRFTVSQRRNVMCAVASVDRRRDALKLESDSHVCSSILDRGHHLVHVLGDSRAAWVHILTGEASVNGVSVAEGDGIGVISEPAVSVTALEWTELLLIDVAR